jgi:AcrR family transcriptional regulator
MDTSAVTGSTAERILDAAEQLFAMRGYYGVSIREVAELSATELSLTRYHFGSKDELFKRVVARRAEPVTRALSDSLTATLRLQTDVRSTELIIRAFIIPIAGLPRLDERWRNFLKLMINSDSLSQRPELLKPLRDAYAPVFNRYVEELARSGCRRERACWVMHFMHWMLGHIAFEVYELEKLSGGACASSDYETLVERMATFIIGGALALCQPGTKPPATALRGRSFAGAGAGRRTRA